MNNTNTHKHLADPLWSRIAAYPIDDPKATQPFSAKLAAEQGWTQTFTRQAIEEYKRFMYLCCISLTGASPSKIVDEVWHLHLTYTTDYWQKFCKETLHKDIHHYPSKGGNDEYARHTKWHDDTIQLYNSTFGTYPPQHIWPGQQHGAQEVYNEQQGNFPEDKNVWKYALLLIPLLVIILLYGEPNPFHLSGRHFLVFFAMLGVSTIALQAVIQIRRSRQLKDAQARQYTTDKYAQAYLAGNYERVALLMVVELIDSTAIALTDDDIYEVNYILLTQANTPLALALKQLNQATITAQYLKDIALETAQRMAMPHLRLKEEYEKRTHSLWLSAVTMIAGIARTIQGIDNGKPVAFLMIMMLVFSLVSLILYKAFDFHLLCRKTLCDTTELPANPEKDITGQVILFGIAPLIALPLYKHMRQIYHGDAYGGDGGSSGGCSSGGGCGGGGCGGCGGS